MSETKNNKKTEAAEASKKSILDAAEQVFAHKGYEASSLQEICDLAGVTRGLPNYFFGSKEALYRAVLERIFARVHDLLLSVREQLQQPTTNPRDVLAMVIGTIFDMLVAHPTFIRLTEWEALQENTYLGQLPGVLHLLRDALQMLQEDMHWQGNAEQFLIDLTALCWFPLAHTETFLKPLGVDSTNHQFLTQRRAHVINTLLQQIDAELV